MGHYVLHEGLFWEGAGKGGKGPKPLGFVCRVGHFTETSKSLQRRSASPPMIGPPRIFPSRRPVALEVVVDSCLSDPGKVIAKLHVNWGHSSAQQPQRVLVDSGGETMCLVKFAGGVPKQCNVRRAFDKAPEDPIEGAPPASSFNGKLGAGLSFVGSATARRAKDSYSDNSLSVPVRPKNPVRQLSLNGYPSLSVPVEVGGAFAVRGLRFPAARKASRK